LVLLDQTSNSNHFKKTFTTYKSELSDSLYADVVFSEDESLSDDHVEKGGIRRQRNTSKFEEISGATSLFVNFLPPEVDSADLTALFQKCGCKGFLSAYVKSHKTKPNQFIGFANFVSHEFAKEALDKVQGSTLFSRKLKFHFSNGLMRTTLKRLSTSQRSPPPSRPTGSDERPSSSTRRPFQTEYTPEEEEARGRHLLAKRGGEHAAKVLLHTRDSIQYTYPTESIEFKTKQFLYHQFGWIDFHFRNFMDTKHGFKRVEDIKPLSRNKAHDLQVLSRSICGIWENLSHITLMSRSFPEYPSLPEILQILFRDITPTRHELTHSFQTVAHDTVDIVAFHVCINECMPLIFEYYLAFKESWVVYGGAAHDIEADYDPIEASYTKYG
jgi:RNA recognition motif-containing protein